MSKQSLLIAALCGLCLVCQAEAATIIIQDGFSGANGASLQGRTPDTADLPGGTYTLRNYFGQLPTAIDTSTGVPSPSAAGDANNLAYISLASAGSYVKPATFEISANVVGSSSAGIFVDLGFFVGDPGTGNGNHVGTDNGFNGVRFGADGSLSLKTSDASTGGTENVSLIHAYDASVLGPLSTTSFYKLSYDVNTATGGISNVTLSDSHGSVTYSVATTNFTDAHTNLTGFATGSGTGGTFAHIDNFTITQTPEPSSLMLCGLGAIGLLIAARRRRRA